MKPFRRKNKISKKNILPFTATLLHILYSLANHPSLPRIRQAARNLSPATLLYPHDKTPAPLTLHPHSAANKLTQIYLSSLTHQFYRPNPSGTVCTIPSITLAFRHQIRQKLAETLGKPKTHKIQNEIRNSWSVTFSVCQTGCYVTLLLSLSHTHSAILHQELRPVPFSTASQIMTVLDTSICSRT